MFINFTNHPSGKWGHEQTASANAAYGSIVDLPFPMVPTDAGPEWISNTANEQLEKMDSIFADGETRKEVIFRFAGFRKYVE